MTLDYSKIIKEQLKLQRKLNREAIIRWKVEEAFEDQDRKDNPQKYCSHLESVMIKEGIKCKKCGYIDKL